MGGRRAKFTPRPEAELPPIGLRVSFFRNIGELVAKGTTIRGLPFPKGYTVDELNECAREGAIVDLRSNCGGDLSRYDVGPGCVTVTETDITITDAKLRWATKYA